MRDLLFGSYVALFVSTIFALVERVIYHCYPNSPGLQVVDDAFAILVGIGFIWIIIVNIASYFKRLHDARRQSNIRK